VATTTVYPSGVTTPDDWSLAAGSSKVSAVAGPDDDATSYLSSGTTSGTYQYFTVDTGLSAGDAVPYTHLTLPTNSSVSLSVVAL